VTRDEGLVLSSKPSLPSSRPGTSDGNALSYGLRVGRHTALEVEGEQHHIHYMYVQRRDAFPQ
jgi:hypothetical protein